MGLKILLGTNNQGKVRELRALLKETDIEVVSLADFTECKEAAETGKTFEANARKKALAYSNYTGLPTLADDSGLAVACLNGKPGVCSARFAGERCTYEDNNKKLLGLLKDRPLSKRKAKFISVIAFYHRRKCIQVVRGECAGRIGFSVKGANGFGYDPVFIPEGSQKTFAELSPRTKNRISHRAKALRAIKPFILRYLAKL